MSYFDKQYCYVQSAHGYDGTQPLKRHLSFCNWTLVSVYPEMLVSALPLIIRKERCFF